MLDPLQIVRVVEENMKAHGLPFPAPREALYSWAKPLKMPDRGSPMLYTGGLYQITPYIMSVVDSLSKFEDLKLISVALKASRLLSTLGLSGLVVRPRADTVSYVENILRSIVELLRKAGVNVAYGYEDDLYSGVLLYDLGLDELFKEHAVKVYKALKSREAKTIITVDPHTTHIMRSVYPKYVEGYDLEVKSYLEVLAEAGLKTEQQNGGDVVIHDPCLYARFEGVIGQPRFLLQKSGFKVLEPRRSGRMTYCCGGPIEGLAPKMAKTIAKTRLSELSEKHGVIVTLCPICYANLKSVSDDKVKVEDIALLLGGREL
ncbi:MAG: (Fe-S)-binding protein [Thermoprotei archaeon]|nr:(Fe-S)-binding protein [Thermoprotei archaeon]